LWEIEEELAEVIRKSLKIIFKLIKTNLQIQFIVNERLRLDTQLFLPSVFIYTRPLAFFEKSFPLQLASE